MAQPYTVRFGGGIGSPGATLIVFTALEGYTWVLRDVVLFIAASAAATATLNLVTGGSSLPLWIVSASTSSTWHLELRQIVQPGEQLTIDSPTAAWTAVLTGYQLDNPPGVTSNKKELDSLIRN